MLKLAIVLGFAIVPLPAMADSCRWVNAIYKGYVIRFLDVEGPGQFEVSLHGREPFLCVELDNRLPRGPFPAMCDGAGEPHEVEFSFFPDQFGNGGQVMLFDNQPWYRRCGP